MSGPYHIIGVLVTLASLVSGCGSPVMPTMPPTRPPLVATVATRSPRTPVPTPVRTAAPEVPTAVLAPDEATVPPAIAAALDARRPEPLGPAPPSDGLELELIGPARVTVADPHGQMVGVDPAMESPVIVTSIPGSRYHARSDTQLVVLTATGPFVATMRVSGAQPLQLTVRAFAGNRQTSQATFTLIEEVGTVMTLPLAAGQAPGSLRLHLSRPGHTPPARAIEPEAFVAGPAAAERRPPLSRARVDPATAGQYRVMLEADDEPDGSGVAAIYYRIGEPELGNSLPPVYREPLLVPAGATVRFQAIDRAGNRERAQEIVVP